MKTAAEIYEIILATARRQAETSAQGRAIRNSPILRTADDLDMLLALIMGNIASYVTLTTDVDAMKNEISLLADQCAAIANAGSGDVNAKWVANQLRAIVGAA